MKEAQSKPNVIISVVVKIVTELKQLYSVFLSFEFARFGAKLRNWEMAEKRFKVAIYVFSSRSLGFETISDQLC